MKIIADQQITCARQAFSELGEVVLTDGRVIDPELLQDGDVLLVRSVTRVDESLLQNSPVKFIASATSGTDHIDLEYLKQVNIGFAYAAGCNARSVAEYVLSSLFIIAGHQGFNLQDKTVGIIGCGEVGSRVLNFLTTIGVNCLVNDPPLHEQTGNDLYTDISNILDADIITLHVPLVIDGQHPTRHLVDESFLAKIKRDCILINTSRGDVIDQKSLKKHIKDNPDCVLVMDVWSDEPNIDLELLSHAFIGTPHIAGYSLDGKLKATLKIAQLVYKHFNADLAWCIPFQNFQSECRQIDITDNMDMHDAVMLTVLRHYDTRSDAAPLKRLNVINENERAAYFDSLRKNYPVRREFPATTVQLNSETKQLAEIYEQLGFQVQIQ